MERIQDFFCIVSKKIFIVLQFFIVGGILLEFGRGTFDISLVLSITKFYTCTNWIVDNFDFACHVLWRAEFRKVICRKKQMCYWRSVVYTDSIYCADIFV